MRGQLKGIVHDVSGSGATVWLEPLAVVELGNRWREAQLEEEREVERVLRALSGDVGAQAEAIGWNVEALAAHRPGAGEGALRRRDRRAGAAVRGRGAAVDRRGAGAAPPAARAPSAAARARRPDDDHRRRQLSRAADHRPEHRRQDRRAEDRRAARADGAGRPAGARRPRLARARVRRASSPTSATSRASSSRCRRSAAT